MLNNINSELLSALSEAEKDYLDNLDIINSVKYIKKEKVSIESLIVLVSCRNCPRFGLSN
jgi:hypothetical protein